MFVNSRVDGMEHVLCQNVVNFALVFYKFYKHVDIKYFVRKPSRDLKVK